MTKKISTVLASCALAGVMSVQAQAQDVEFMTWTYTEETGQAAIQAMVDSFEGGTVIPQGYAWGEMSRNIFLRSRSNTLPDVTQVQARLLPTYASLGSLVDLNDVFGREMLEATFDPAFLAMGEIDGRQVALPWISGTIGMVANTEVLEAAGVTDIPTTIEEFEQALIAVRDAVPNSVPYAMASINNGSILLDYLVWTWTFGGDVIVDGVPTADSPEAVAALEFMVGLMNDNLAAPEIDRPDARRLFAQGASAFFIDAPLARTFARQFSGRGEEIDSAVLPIPTPVLTSGDTPVSIQWGHVIAMFGDENATADSPAAQWMMHLLSDDQLIDYAVDQSALPVTLSGIASERVQADAYLSNWAEAAISPRRNTVASLENGALVTDIIGEEVQSALLGQKSAAQAADDMQARLVEVMQP